MLEHPSLRGTLTPEFSHQVQHLEKQNGQLLYAISTYVHLLPELFLEKITPKIFPISQLKNGLKASVKRCY